MSEWKTRITKVQVVKPRVEAGEACLVLIYPPGPDMGKRFPLTRNEIVLGRGADCDIQVDRDSVSRRHARVFRDGEAWMVEDLGSTNGSYVNDVPVQRSVLRDADFLKIGAAIFKFLTGAGVEASYHEEIYRMTIVDGLTGAHNKRYFLEFLERETARCARYKRPLSLLMFDLDHFKAINDTYGHLAGDAVIRTAIKVIRQHSRQGDLVGRYGGEEFVLCLPGTEPEQAMATGERICRVLEASCVMHDGKSIHATVSIGIAQLRGDESIEQWLARADKALYEAKDAGRNQCVLAD